MGRWKVGVEREGGPKTAVGLMDTRKYAHPHVDRASVSGIVV